MPAHLDHRLRTLLPPLYQATYEQVRPVSMGSAGLKYDADGRVAWNEIWQTFCDLAMAGGPPHRGSLLEPATPADVSRAPDACAAVTAELCRGIGMVTALRAEPGDPGWVRVRCTREVMASWLVRAVVMENVSARREGAWLDLPAGPAFRVVKEVKNVVTAIAKTCHYWTGHMTADQQARIADLFVEMELASPLVVPQLDGSASQADADAVGRAASASTGFAPVTLAARGWCGVDCGSVDRAVWVMRALVTENVLVRREETTLCLPVHPTCDPGGRRVAAALARVAPLAPDTRP